MSNGVFRALSGMIQQAEIKKANTQDSKIAEEKQKNYLEEKKT